MDFYLDQKTVLSNEVLIKLINNTLTLKKSEGKGLKFEKTIALCFIALGNCIAFKSINKDVFVYLRPECILYDYFHVILVECKNIETDIQDNDMKSLLGKLVSYSYFQPLGLFIHKTKLQIGAIATKGRNPIIVLNVKEIIDYLKTGKGIDELIFAKFATL